MSNLTGPAMRRGSRKTIALASAATLALAMSTSGSYALTPQLELLFSHFLECKALLLQGRFDEHIRICNPGPTVFPLESASPATTSDDSDIPLPPDTTPPEEECEPQTYFTLTEGNDSSGGGGCDDTYNPPA